MAKAKDPEHLKDDLAALAERVARDAFAVTLDYSVDSVREVERILGRLHDDYRRTRDDRGLHGAALEFAAYLIEVIELHHPPAGAWTRDHPSLGPEIFPYAWRDAEIFPYAWCAKRIFDGPGDDVWAKFQAVVLSKA